MQAGEDAARTADVLIEERTDGEATGPGATGKLTGPKEAPRQQQ